MEMEMTIVAVRAMMLECWLASRQIDRHVKWGLDCVVWLAKACAGIRSQAQVLIRQFLISSFLGWA